MHSKAGVHKEKLQYISVFCIVLIIRALEHITNFNLLILLNDSSLKNVGLVYQVIPRRRMSPLFLLLQGTRCLTLQSCSPSFLWCYFSLIRLTEQHKWKADLLRIPQRLFLCQGWGDKPGYRKGYRTYLLFLCSLSRREFVQVNEAGSSYAALQFPGMSCTSPSPSWQHTSQGRTFFTQ